MDGVSTPHPRGHQLVQSSGSGHVGSLDTSVYDVDTTHVDAEGGQVLWLKHQGPGRAGAHPVDESLRVRISIPPSPPHPAAS